MSKLRVENLTRRTTLADCADVADTSATRRTGLLRHDGLKPGEGLWILPCEGVHTFGMKFAIDVLFLGKRNKSDNTVKVLYVKHSMPKARIAFKLLGHSVLELPAGRAKETSTETGDMLKLERFELPAQPY